MSRSQVVSFMSGVLLGVFLLVSGYVLGPVMWAEARYQVLSLGEALGFRERMSAVQEVSASGDYTLEIPKLYLKEPVIPEVDPFDPKAYEKALSKGIAHAAGTGYPGEDKLGYYFGHSSNSDLNSPRLNAVFYTLYKLESGDSVFLTQGGTRWQYRVIEKRVTEADDVELIVNAPSEEKIALQTCWPVGTSSKRLLVTAERV